jgi:hypothetical protein
MLFKESPEFRALCEDFHDSLKAREYWCQNSVGKESDTALCAEYTVLCSELREEIATYLAEYNKAGHVDR